jgi:hypothetical protein
MKKFLLPLSVLGLFLAPLHAEDYKIPKKNSVFSISFPDKWTVTHADDNVDAITEDESIQLNAQLDDAETLEKSIEESIDYLTKAGVKIKADSKKEHESEVNGMKIGGVNWDATDEEGACRVSLSFIDIGGEKVITLLYWGSEEASKEHAKDLEGILNSMKTLKGGAKADDKEEDAEEEEEEEN